MLLNLSLIKDFSFFLSFNFFSSGVSMGELKTRADAVNYID